MLAFNLKVDAQTKSNYSVHCLCTRRQLEMESEKPAAISPMNNLISFLRGLKNLQHEGIFTAAMFADA